MTTVVDDFFIFRKGKRMKLVYSIALSISIISTGRAAIKNIFFDVGGVILADGPAYFAQTLINQEERETARAIAKSNAWHAWIKGKILRNELSATLAQYFDVALVEWIIAETLNPQRPFIKETVAIIKQLKAAGYRLYILSNFSQESYDTFVQDNDLFNLFDGMIFSYQVGCLKPDHEIYNRLLDIYHLDAEESLFIDDSVDNINSARELGIDGIVYQQGTLIAALQELQVTI